MATRNLPTTDVRPQSEPHRTLVVLQASPFCNIDCRYCYLPQRSDTARMSTAVLARIFEEVLSSRLTEDPIVFLWHLGEPLSLPLPYYQNAFALCAQINTRYGRTYSHSFQTNATLINADWINLIREHRVGVGVSVDGPAFIHDRQRINRAGHGTHAAVMRGITQLQEAGIGFSAITVLTSFTLNHVDELYRFYLDHHLLDIGFNIDEIEGSNANSSFADHAAPARYRQFLTTLLEKISQDDGALKVREFWTTLKSVASARERPFNTLIEPLKMINFDHLGNFSTFCPELVAGVSAEYQDFRMGNILKGSLAAIYDNPVFQRVQREIQSGVERCEQSCAYWDLCGGGSPSNKFFETGRFDVSETLACRVHKKTVVDVLLDHFS